MVYKYVVHATIAGATKMALFQWFYLTDLPITVKKIKD
jgi:hypothetical protein